MDNKKMKNKTLAIVLVSFFQKNKSIKKGSDEK